MTADEETKKQYQDVCRVLAELLSAQAIFIEHVTLIADDGTVNAKALGYIYGFADCALHIAKLDIGTGYGLGTLMFLLMEFDQANATKLFDYLNNPPELALLMKGVMIGGIDYNEWASSHGERVPLRWKECF